MLKKILALFVIVITIMVVFLIGCPTSSQEEGTTTTKAPATTTTTTIIELTNDPTLTFTATELQRGCIIDPTGDKLMFGIPDNTYDAAMALDPSVKSISHHGEYWGAWNWNDLRPGVTREGDPYLRIRGTNVVAQLSITLSKFISDTEGVIWSSWGNPVHYNWGFKICGADGNQLPDAGAGGTVPNWIAKLDTDTTQWAIKDTDFGGTINTVNAEVVATDFGATTTLTPFKDLAWGIGAAFTVPAWEPDSHLFTRQAANLYDLTFDLTANITNSEFGVANTNAWTYKFTGADVTDDDIFVQLTYNAANNAKLSTTNGAGIYKMTMTTNDDTTGDISIIIVNVKVAKQP